MTDFYRKALFVAAAALAVAFAFQGSRALWAPDEGIFGAVSKEMIESGNWLVPTLHHEPYPEKPPLIYWMMVVGMDLMGRNEWGLRLFFALTLPLTAWFVGLIGTELWGRREGLLAALVYATMILPVAGANVARPDAPLTLFVAAAFFYFIKSVRAVPPLSSQERGPGGGVTCKLLMCAAFGLGFLSKGPAVLVFAAPMFLYLLLTGRALRFFLTPWAIVGAGIFAVVGLSWYWAMIRQVPGAAAYFWDNQVWGRLVTSTYRRNPDFLEGVYKVYGPALLGGALPWALLWPYWVVKWRRRSAPPAGALVAPPDSRGGVGSDPLTIFNAAWWKSMLEHRNALLLALWVVLPVAVFMVAKSKLHLYVMPVFPALALLTARAWALYPPPLLTRTDGFPRPRVVYAWVFLLIAAKCVAAHPESLQRFGINLADHDERQLAIEIEKHLPPDCAQIMLVNEELNGIAFYMQPSVLDATVRTDDYPSFTPCPQLSQLVDKALASKISFVVYCRNARKQLNVVEAVFNERGIGFTETELPNTRILLIPAVATSKTLADKPPLAH